MKVLKLKAGAEQHSILSATMRARYLYDLYAG